MGEHGCRPSGMGALSLLGRAAAERAGSGGQRAPAPSPPPARPPGPAYHH